MIFSDPGRKNACQLSCRCYQCCRSKLGLTCPKDKDWTVQSINGISGWVQKSSSSLHTTPGYIGLSEMDERVIKWQYNTITHCYWLTHEWWYDAVSRWSGSVQWVRWYISTGWLAIPVSNCQCKPKTQREKHDHLAGWVPVLRDQHKPHCPIPAEMVSLRITGLCHSPGQPVQ